MPAIESTMTAVAVDTDLAPLAARKSLRAKAFVATMALVAYVLVSAVYIAFERASIHASIESMNALSKHEKTLALTAAAVDGALTALVHIGASGQAGQPDAGLRSEIATAIESCNKLFAELEQFDPSYALLQRSIARSYVELQANRAPANWLDLREALERAAADIDIRHSGLAQRRDELIAHYQRQFDAVTIESLLLSLLGIAVFGALAAWFFSRLARDIRQLESHARRIVRGARGVILPATREDELGRLIHAVNQMSADLEQREHQIELETERRSHNEKMIAVGALAAGVAHEVNNPLAVIAGAAQQLCALQDEALTHDLAQAARLILAQTERAALATRTLAEVAALQPSEFDWVDINAIVRRVLQLMGYDKRYRHITFESTLATDLPAVHTSGAAIQQVLMQLLALGCDALPKENGRAQVQVSTVYATDWVEIGLAIPVVLDLTRPGIRRTLLLVRAIIEPLHARIELDQDASGAQRIRLTWPAGSSRPE